MKDAIYILVIVLMAAYLLYDKLSESDKPKRDYSKAYQARLLLTKNEWKCYMTMRDPIETLDMRICPKVRLLDLAEPKKGTTSKEWGHLKNRVQSKHVDFVICDRDMRVKLIIELDDSTHDAQDRKDRDAFVDTVLTGCGFQILHIRSIDTGLPVILAALKQPAAATEAQ